jgi:hypothetical protein
MIDLKRDHPPGNATMFLSVVIPVYNERRTLGTVLTKVARSLPEVSKEVIGRR